MILARFRAHPVLIALLSIAVRGDVQPAVELPPHRPGTTTSRFTDLFRPARTERAALSPDGRLLAYTVREDDKVSVLVVPIDTPGTALVKMPVIDDRVATRHFTDDGEPTPGRVNWMKWVTNDRLVLETNAQVSVGPQSSVPGLIMAFNANGSNAGILVTPRHVRELATTTPRESTIARDRTPLTATVDNAEFGAPAPDPSIASTTGLFQTDPDAIPPAQAPDEFSSNPLTPRIFDLDPANPSGVLVRTVGTNAVVLYRLDVNTGKLAQVSDHAFEDDREALLDRQGKPRISTPNSSTIKFPHHLTLDRGPGHDRSRILAKAAGMAENAFAVSPENFFGERALPLGFDENPSVLYYASNIGRDTYGIYGVDLATGKSTGVALEHPKLDLITLPNGAFGPSETLVFDRHTRRLAGIRLVDRVRTTRWLEGDLQAVQALLEKSLPGRSVDILEWDVQRQRFLAATSGPTEPGGLVVLDRASGKLTEFARRAPWLDAFARNRTISMAVEVQPGIELPCRITFSTNARVKPQPLIVICPNTPWERLPVDFQPEVQALAEMGFAVLQTSSRGAWGYGVRQRSSIHEGYDDAQVADLLRIIDEVGKSFAVDSRRVGLVGVGHGGYLALRAMQTAPDRFRCGVVIEPRINVAKWLGDTYWQTRAVEPQLVRTFFGPPERLRENVLVRDAEKILRPLLVFSHPGQHGATRRDDYMTARSFATKVRRPGVEVEFAELSTEAVAGLPRAQAAVYQSIEYFLNTYVYDFSVKLGDPVEVK